MTLEYNRCSTTSLHSGCLKIAISPRPEWALGTGQLIVPSSYSLPSLLESNLPMSAWYSGRFKMTLGNFIELFLCITFFCAILCPENCSFFTLPKLYSLPSQLRLLFLLPVSQPRRFPQSES